MTLPKLSDGYSQENSRKLFHYFDRSQDRIYSEVHDNIENVMPHFFKSVAEIFAREDKLQMIAEFIVRLQLQEMEAYVDTAKNYLIERIGFKKEELEKEMTDCRERFSSEAESKDDVLEEMGSLNLSDNESSGEESNTSEIEFRSPLFTPSPHPEEIIDMNGLSHSTRSPFKLYQRT